jgi:hypothetical protein
MLENQIQFAILATEARIREMQLRKGIIDGSGRRIFRLVRDRAGSRPAERR